MSTPELSALSPSDRSERERLREGEERDKEKERERDIKRNRGRERKGGREIKREMKNMVALILKGITGA